MMESEMDKEQHEYLSKKDIGYLAAMVDQNANIYIFEDPRDRRANPEINLQVIVRSPNFDLLNLWKAKTGLGSIHLSSFGYHWRCHALTGEKLLRLVVDDLLCAPIQERARIALEFRKTFAVDERPLSEATLEKRRYYRRVMMELGGEC